MILYIYYNNTAQNNFGIFSRKLFWNIKLYKSNIYLNIKTFRIRLLFYTHRYIYSTFLRSPKVTFYPLLPPPGFVPLAPYFTTSKLPDLCFFFATSSSIIWTKGLMIQTILIKINVNSRFTQVG